MKTEMTTQPPAAGEAAHIADELISITKRLKEAVATIRPASVLVLHATGFADRDDIRDVHERNDEHHDQLVMRLYRMKSETPEAFVARCEATVRACNAYDSDQRQISSLVVELQNERLERANDQRKIKALVKAAESIDHTIASGEKVLASQYAALRAALALASK